jgi:nicotinamidase-related amidase
MKGAPLLPISRSNTALVLHDMQNDFIKASLSKPEMQAAVKRTKNLIDLAHALPIPMIYTRVENDPAVGFPVERAPYLRRAGSVNCVKGTPGSGRY